MYYNHFFHKCDIHNPRQKRLGHQPLYNSVFKRIVCLSQLRLKYVRDLRYREFCAHISSVGVKKYTAACHLLLTSGIHYALMQQYTKATYSITSCLTKGLCQ